MKEWLRKMFGQAPIVEQPDKYRKLRRAELIHQRRLKAAKLATQKAFDSADEMFRIASERRGK